MDIEKTLEEYGYGLSAMAWYFFIKEGKGHIFIDDRKNTPFEECKMGYISEKYYPGDIYPQLTELINKYDPKKEWALVVIGPLDEDGDCNFDMRILTPKIIPVIAYENLSGISSTINDMPGAGKTNLSFFKSKLKE